MILTYKKNFDENVLNVLTPVKNDKLHISSINYLEEPLIVQLKGNLQEKNSIKLLNDGKKNIEFLDKIQNSIVDIIHKNTQKFFNGKEFSIEKIQNAMSKLYVINKSGEYFLKFKETDNTSYFDCFNEPIELENLLGSNCDVALQLDITYIKSVINIDLTCKGIKECKKKETKVIFLEPEPKEIKKTQDAPPQIWLEVEKTPEKTDDLDFF